MLTTPLIFPLTGLMIETVGGVLLGIGSTLRALQLALVPPLLPAHIQLIVEPCPGKAVVVGLPDAH